jgi:hypothetical protein
MVEVSTNGGSCIEYCEDTFDALAADWAALANKTRGILCAEAAVATWAGSHGRRPFQTDDACRL